MRSMVEGAARDGNFAVVDDRTISRKTNFKLRGGRPLHRFAVPLPRSAFATRRS